MLKTGDSLLQYIRDVERQDAGRALTMARSDVSITRWTKDAGGYQAAKAAELVARGRLIQNRKGM